MECPKCSHPNEEGALFCNNCGSSLNGEKKDWNSILLLGYCFSILFFSLLYIVFNYFFTMADVSWQTRNYFYTGFHIIQALLMLIIPLGIRKVWMRILAFIVLGIAALISIIQGINVLSLTINSGV